MKLPSLFATMLVTILLLTSCSGSKHNSEAPTGVGDPLNNSSVNNGEFSFETHVAPYQEGGLSKELHRKI